jgi:hypothetical protein
MGRRKKLFRKVEAGEISFTQHAYKQMMARDIYIQQVREALLNGQVVQRWDDRDGVKMAIVGKRFNGDYIKVVIKDTEPPSIITVCYPYEEVKF